MVIKTWIVLGEEKGDILLVSKSNIESNGLLPNGAYITVIDGDIKFILRVEESYQHSPYSPSPMIVDMDLSPLTQDQKCQNIIHASRIMEYPERNDGKLNFIKPQKTARRSNQDEIDIAFGNKEGMPVFPATFFARNCQNLCDDAGNFMQVKISDEVFFHQTLITGRTGSGKTVAMKYMAQYFLENYANGDGGAVLAINVKEEDMLTMDKKSMTKNPDILKEWSDLRLKPHGVETYKIYYPGNKPIKYSNAVSFDKCEGITLKTEHIDPETLTGLIQNISAKGADQLPAIFRYWQKKIRNHGDTLTEFVRYFGDPEKERIFTALNALNEEVGDIKIHAGTYQNVLNALTYATEFFDISGAKELNSKDILQEGKLSVIDVTSKKGFGFGSVLLRDLLEKIYDENSNREESERTPILIIIDEVHEFYGSAKSREALQTLDAICRKGRSLKIGIIFASQNPEDMPRGISSVVNSKIFFKSDIGNSRSMGTKISGFDPEALRPGYGIARIHGLGQLRFLKFPMSLAGVNNENK